MKIKNILYFERFSVKQDQNLSSLNRSSCAFYGLYDLLKVYNYDIYTGAQQVPPPKKAQQAPLVY